MKRTPTDAPPIVVRDLAVRYGRSRVLESIGFEVRRGALYALLGRNGAGKSSAVNCVLGLRPPDRGSAELFGRDAWRDRRALMHRVGVVPERPSVPPHATPRAAARFVAALRGGFDPEGFERRLQGLGVSSTARFGALSRGQQTLVQLSLALAGRPELLVLDDPTLGLDAVARQELYDELVDTLATGDVSVLLTTHDLDGVERFATDVGILDRGRLVVNEPLDELKRRWSSWSVPAGASSPGLAAADHRVVERVPEPWGGERWTLRDEDALGAGREPPAGATCREMTLQEIFAAVTGVTRRATAGSRVGDPAGGVAEGRP